MSNKSNVSFTMKELKQLAPAVAAQKFPIMIRGRHGIGKSEFVYQLAADESVSQIPSEVVEMRASQMSEGDLVGLPFRGDDLDVNGQKVGSTQWNPPDWFLKACAQPVTLFFDEVDRATQEVRQGLFQLNDSRQLNGHKLHPDTVVFACINGGHGSSYQVQEMDPAELDRYTVYDLEPTTDEWIEWASNNCFREVVGFIRSYPAFLDGTAASYDPKSVYPSRRSWTRLSSVMKEMFPKGLTDASDESLSFIFAVSTGFVGKEAAMAFRGYMSENLRKVDPVSIFLNGDFDGVEGWTAPEWVDLLEKAHGKKMFTLEVFATIPLENVARVIMEAPVEIFCIIFKYLSEMDVKFTGSFLTGSYDHPASATLAKWFFDTLIMGQEDVRALVEAGATVEAEASEA